MYTLNLKDIDITPRINIDKSFEGDDQDKVVDSATDFINENYKDVYNPYTLRRKCDEVTLHDGVSPAQERKQRENAQDKKWDAEAEKIKEEGEKRSTEYEEKAKVIYQKYDELKAKVSEKFNNKATELNFETESDDYKKAVEEFETERESLEWEQDKELKKIL